ncbi:MULTISPECIES: hypothetical protein [unclassified Schlesneria]
MTPLRIRLHRQPIIAAEARSRQREIKQLAGAGNGELRAENSPVLEDIE